MKRIIISTMLIVTLIWVYNGWIDVGLPQTAEGLNNDLDQHALAYEVIDGTPLIVATFGGSIFLDTIQLERISMNIPPYPRWQWTGNWERVSDPTALATVDLSNEFGPTVLFGMLNDDAISSIQVLRDGEIIFEYAVGGPAYIVPAEHILLTDTVQFLDAGGNVLSSKRPID